jgi:uncharacterized C2H2 Zn-finger protein
MSERKVNPNEVIKYREENPCLSGSEIGKHFRISRQRTNIILKEAGMQTTSTKWGKGTICPDCGNKKGRGSVTCRECYGNRHMVPIVCDQCGKVFTRSKSQVLYHTVKNHQKTFCSRKHLGQYVGANYGFTKHPENVSRSGSRPKVNQENIIDLFKAGYKQVEISDLTGIKYPTIHYTLFKSELGKKENFPKVR